MADNMLDFLRQTIPVIERHVALGEKHIYDQIELIAKLERDDHDATLAKELLRQFEEIQALHLRHRDRITMELSEGEARERRSFGS